MKIICNCLTHDDIFLVLPQVLNKLHAIGLGCFNMYIVEHYHMQYHNSKFQK